MGGGVSRADDELWVFEEINPGFFRVAVKFPMAMGMIDIGSHMGLIRLDSGKFVAIDTVDPNASIPFNGSAGEIKHDIDLLTENGTLLEAVIATHPYHTLYFPPFYQLYPDAKYYGTPRHLRVQTDIPWVGSVADAAVLALYEPEIQMRIPPTGSSEFDNPLPPASNHFSNAFVLSHGVLFNDDLLMYLENPKKRIGFIASVLAGLKHDSLLFHISMYKVGLRHTPDSAPKLIVWLEQLLEDWDFEVIASAHNGVLKSNAKARIGALLDEERPKLMEFAEHYANIPEQEGKECADCVDNGAWSSKPGETECG
eukprot:CAMPEP_0113938906 /NCGR_PEP_ID=MMETSP1339-20121228/5316_1 /TAXON_ID=94617 /ORGANISM="Fibrocapsa japonica" /LENGTH=311 /DNA_ID=CAMNT_0000942235 /DNA_START=71 /DNA_END=1006 /DNA_ORIENTATION=- /assembly_acc=CAM_ASM_000762